MCATPRRCTSLEACQTMRFNKIVSSAKMMRKFCSNVSFPLKLIVLIQVYSTVCFPGDRTELAHPSTFLLDWSMR